jgi:hypothetical protein
VWVGKMSDGRKSSAVDVSKAGKTTSKPGSLLRPGISLGAPGYCPGGVRHTGSMSPTEALLWNV